METEPVREIARAKLNLCLHVTGKRPDGYHLLDSLVAFASFGDEVTASLAPATTLRVTGPEAAGLEAETDNLVLRAARLMGVSADLTLEKVLPVASGVGGGSADAAATLRALSRLSGRPLPDADKVLALGADVPVCLRGQAARMRGIGEQISRLPSLPKTWLVMVNPRQPVSTAAVFARLTNLDNPPIPEPPTSGWTSVEGLSDWLRVMTRNDLEDPAMAIAPAIGKVLTALSRTRSCMLARMSGSGATCFGIFGSEAASLAAGDLLKARHPDWWIRQAALQPGR